MKAALNDNYFGMMLLDHPPHEHLWFEVTKIRLEWRPIADYMASELGLGDPVILRADDHWVLGCWTNLGWAKFTEGACWPIAGFEPTEYAEPSLEDLMMLAQE